MESNFSLQQIALVSWRIGTLHAFLREFNLQEKLQIYISIWWKEEDKKQNVLPKNLKTLSFYFVV